MTTEEILLVAALFLVLVLLILGSVRKRRIKRARERDPYLEALRHLVNGEEEIAYSCLVETVKQDTSNIDAYIILGDLLRRRGDCERAHKVHQNVTLRSDLTLSINRTVLKSLALDQIAMNRWSGAEETLIKLQRLDKKDIWARLRLLEVYEAEGNWNKAYELGKELAGEPGIDGSRLAGYKVESARTLIEMGSCHKGRIILKEALKHDDACTEAYLTIGDTYAEEGKVEEAVEWWERMVDMVPESASVVFNRLEDALYQLGAFSKMADIYSRHLNANPDSAEAAMALAHLLERKGEVEEAIELLNKHRHHVPEVDHIDREVARLYYKSGSPEKALEFLFGTVMIRKETGGETEEDATGGPDNKDLVELNTETEEPAI